MGKPDAIRTLDAELLEIKEAIRKSRVMLNELGNSYFGKIYEYNHEELAVLFHLHDYYEPYYDIAFDYVVEADEKLQALLKSDSQLKDEKKEVDYSTNVSKLNTSVA
jgi:hypothetical protein